MPHVGTYRRTLPVSLERLYENALDWEHLPYLHRTTFTSIDCIDAQGDQWCATVGLQPDGREIELQLALDRGARRWITTTRQGSGAGTEIWTHAFATGEKSVDIVVDFFVPGATDDNRAGLGAFYCSLYERLYDEDVSMMVGRQRAIDEQAAAPRSPASVILDDVAGRTTVDVGGRMVCVAPVEGELVAFPARCPHRFGPLDEGVLEDGVIECPWHGYRFDVRTGNEVTGRRCRLPRVADVAIDGSVVTVTAR